MTEPDCTCGSTDGVYHTAECGIFPEGFSAMWHKAVKQVQRERLDRILYGANFIDAKTGERIDPVDLGYPVAPTAKDLGWC